VLDRCIVISFDAEACRLARTAGAVSVGWVLDADPASRQTALEELRPEFVFCDHRRLPAGLPVPGGPWTWAVYEVTTAELALELHGRGVSMVESMAPLRLRAELATRAGQHA
jgi:glycerophosphoryl diester phosphodiesterase